MQTSVAGVEFLKGFESCRLTVYDDVGHPAIGWGHDLYPEQLQMIQERYPNGITQEDADKILSNDLLKYESAVNDYLPLTQGQFDALVDFAYNLGVGSLQTMMAHGKDQVPTQLVRWNHVAGAVNTRLTERRQGELQMWLS